MYGIFRIYCSGFIVVLCLLLSVDGKANDPMGEQLEEEVGDRENELKTVKRGELWMSEDFREVATKPNTRKA